MALAAVWRWEEGRRVERAEVGRPAVIWGRNDNGWEPTGGSGKGEKRTDVGYILR